MAKFYLVGGAVRDELLGLEAAERDWVAVGATPAKLEAMGFRRLDADFPVFSHPETGEEYALARRERKTAAGHKGFVLDFGPDVTLEEDLRRRDLRINAMARSESGEIIDPFGGQADLKARTLRHVSPAFVEDPLRVLRAARFAARFEPLGFSIHPSTRELMRAMSARKEMGALSSGRIWRETEAALRATSPARYFYELDQCGAMRVLLPELASRGEAETQGDAIPDRCLRALESAARLDARPEVRFAALAATLEAPAGMAALDAVLDRLKVPGRFADLAHVASGLRRDLASGKPARAKPLLRALENADAFRRVERFNDALLACRAATAAGEEELKRKIPDLERAVIAARRIKGAEVAGSGLEGAAVAEELHRRRLAAIEEALDTSHPGGDASPESSDTE